MDIGVPVGKQRTSIVEATARFNLWHGAVRSSKTVGSIIRLLEYVATTTNDNILVGGKTERTLRRNVIQPIKDLLGPGQMHTLWGMGEGTLWGKRLYFIGANDERSEDKIRGLTAGGGYLDELSTWPQSTFEMFRSRCSMPGAQMFATTNPDAPTHWVKKELLDRESDLDMRSWHFTIDDNPFLDATFVANLKREYTGLWYKRFIDGLWVVAEGAIWDMFGDELIVDDKHMPRMVRYWVAVDYGTVNPFVALLIGQGSDEDGDPALFVIDEWRWDSRKEHRQKTDTQYSTALRDWIKAKRVKPAAIYCDPSAASFMLQLKHDKAGRVQGAENTVLDGLRGVGTLFSNMRLFVHKRCTGLIDEIQSYVWDEDAQEKGEDKPLKQNDHGPDALRYGMRMLTPLWQRWVKAA